MFFPLWPSLPGPGRQRAIFLAHVFWKPGYDCKKSGASRT